MVTLSQKKKINKINSKYWLYITLEVLIIANIIAIILDFDVRWINCRCDES